MPPKVGWNAKRAEVEAHRQGKAQRAQQRQQEQNPLVAMAAKIREEKRITVLIEGEKITKGRTVFGRYTEAKALALLEKVEQSGGRLGAEIELEDVEALSQAQRPLDFMLLKSVHELRVYFAKLNVDSQEISWGKPIEMRRGIVITVGDGPAAIPLLAADFMRLEEVLKEFDAKITGSTLAEFIETFWVADIWLKNHGMRPGEYRLEQIYQALGV